MMSWGSGERKMSSAGSKKPVVGSMIGMGGGAMGGGGGGAFAASFAAFAAFRVSRSFLALALSDLAYALACSCRSTRGYVAVVSWICFSIHFRCSLRRLRRASSSAILAFSAARRWLRSASFPSIFVTVSLDSA